MKSYSPPGLTFLSIIIIINITSDDFNITSLQRYAREDNKSFSTSSTDAWTLLIQQFLQFPFHLNEAASLGHCFEADYGLQKSFTQNKAEQMQLIMAAAIHIQCGSCLLLIPAQSTGFPGLQPSQCCIYQIDLKAIKVLLVCSKLRYSNKTK